MTTAPPTTPLPRWPVPLLLSHGSYTSSDSLHTHPTGPLHKTPLYSSQQSLPNLPVPSLSETMGTMKDSMLAVCESESEVASVEADISAFTAPDSPGVAAQSALLDRAATAQESGTSWLQLWWNEQGYLIPRDPVVINVSYFFQFTRDSTALTGPSRAASLLYQAALFRKSVASGSLSPEAVGKTGDTKLCSTAWKYMFNACRLPRMEKDEYVLHDPSLHTHVVVMRNGHMYTFDFVDEYHDPLPLPHLEGLLRLCVERADSDGKVPCVGVLTSQDRDTWATDREHLLTVHDSIPDSLSLIESSALIINLDSTSPVSRSCASSLLWHGAVPDPNRYFDKSVQVIVSDNGTAGLLGEHSMMDGMPMVREGERGGSFFV